MSGQTLKVAVLMGGISSEKEISMSSGQGVVQALKKLGYPTKEIIVGDDLSQLIADLKSFQPDVVFNALHGKGGEDGCIQGVLEILKIPYTYSFLNIDFSFSKPFGYLFFDFSIFLVNTSSKKTILVCIIFVSFKCVVLSKRIQMRTPMTFFY